MVVIAECDDLYIGPHSTLAKGVVLGLCHTLGGTCKKVNTIKLL